MAITSVQESMLVYVCNYSYMVYFICYMILNTTCITFFYFVNYMK